MLSKCSLLLLDSITEINPSVNPINILSYIHAMYDAFKELKHTPARKGISFHLLNERQQMRSIHLHHVRHSFSKARHFRFVCVVGETKRREKKKAQQRWERETVTQWERVTRLRWNTRGLWHQRRRPHIFILIWPRWAASNKKKALSLLPGKKMSVAKLKEFCFTHQVTRKHQFPINFSIAIPQKRPHENRNKSGIKLVERPLTGACVIKLFRFEFAQNDFSILRSLRWLSRKSNG